jgi:probable rRNA maturation factor
MNILYDEERIPEENYLEKIRKAAEIACWEEGLDPDLCAVSVSFVSPGEIRELNRDYRATDKVTDVLSFPLCEDVEAEYNDFLRVREELCQNEGKTAQNGDFDAAGPEESEPLFELGDIVINKQRAEEQAEAFGHSVEREIVYLATHSVFHLLGYDHETEEDRAAMRAKEEAVMSELGILR